VRGAHSRSNAEIAAALHELASSRRVANQGDEDLLRAAADRIQHGPRAPESTAFGFRIVPDDLIPAGCIEFRDDAGKVVHRIMTGWPK
jgi:hypothetical protein